MTDAYSNEGSDIFVPEETPVTAPPQPQPLFQIYEGSRIVISKQVGAYWKNKLDAALKAYEEIKLAWEEVFRYYNYSQTKSLQTPLGIFHRGDQSENIIFSNLNIMLPAIYSRDPDVTVTTNDKADEAFAECLEAVLNALFKRKNKLYAKPKIKKAAGTTLLTNFGVLKLDWTKKDDSVELAAQELQRISDELKLAKNQERVEELYGELEALERGMEALKPSGPSLGNVLSHNLIIDPYAEQSDALDAMWMIEKVFYPTSALMARFTYKTEEGEAEKGNANRNLIYKPTHKAVFTEGAQGKREDALGMVMAALDGTGNEPVSFEEEGRRTYIDQYFTECYLVWDRALRRVMLFHRDDWTWPLWVWDDPHNLSRFFPYFVIGYSMSTGGTVSVGEASYILDQQDAVNDINRQLAKIRRSVFDFFYYNADTITPDEAEKFINSLRGKTPQGKNMLGVKAGEGGKVQDSIQAFAPPSLQYEQLFDKAGLLDAVNRITNTSDALRGVQFKTNTNVASVQSYQESMRLSVGSKVDVIEDTVADVALALAEMAVQNLSQEDVASLVGAELAQVWQPMTVEEFSARFSTEIVAGSMEKPNSVFRKKEAIEVAQAVGQFARSAPGAVSKIMLKTLERAFTEVAIKKEDWDALDREIEATMQKGVSTPQGEQGGGDLMQAAQALPPEDKREIMEMNRRGESPQTILEFIQQKTGARG